MEDSSTQNRIHQKPTVGQANLKSLSLFIVNRI
jgi:hypothetical protein